jgi:hypothetical protein
MAPPSLFALRGGPLRAAVLIGSLVGCADDPFPLGPGVPVDDEALEGFWYAPTGSDQPTRTLAFFSQRDAPWFTRVDPSDADGPISAVYRDATPIQVARFRSEDGWIGQEVITGPSGDPGQVFFTRIADWIAQESLDLDLGSGQVRRFLYSPRCPLTDSTGSFGELQAPCTPAVESARAVRPALAVDHLGGVHLLAYGRTRGEGTADGPTCGTSPAWVSMPGCEAVDHAIEAIGGFSLLADFERQSLLRTYHDGETLWFDAGPPRSHDRSAERVTDGPVPRVAELLGDALRPVLVLLYDDGSLAVHRRSEAGWSQPDSVSDGTSALVASAASACLDALGRIWIAARLDNGDVQVVHETTPGRFESLALPASYLPHVEGGVQVDAAGRVHLLAWRRGADVLVEGGYLILDRERADVWLPLPSLSATSRLVPTSRAPWRLIREVQRQPTETWLARTEVDEAGRQQTNLLHAWSVGASTRTTTPRCSVAESPDGTLAAMRHDERVRVRWSNAPRGPDAGTLQIDVGGGGRVTDPARAIDCDRPCTIDLPLGSVPALRLVPNDGFVVGPRIGLLDPNGIEVATAPSPEPDVPFDLPIDVSGTTLVVRFEAAPGP